MMNDWCTIESDPGVFTELISNIGVKDVQVEEVIDFDELQSIESEVYALIFLFKYVRKSGYNPKIISDYPQDLYFPQQVINNACGTQAILSALLNKSDRIDIGEDLREFKSFTALMDPYMKGLSISNSDKIRVEHNKFAKPEPFLLANTKQASDDDDVFHYVTYVHHLGNIWELDGLRDGPILIEENVPENEWIERVKPSIMNRISLYATNEIKFNLMAIIPDRKAKFNKNIDELLNKRTQSESEEEKMMIDQKIEELRLFLLEEEEKTKRHRIENVRRQHNYIPLIYEMVKILAEKGALEEIYNESKEEINKK